MASPAHAFAIVNDRRPVYHQTLTRSNRDYPQRVSAPPGAVRYIHPRHSIATIGRRAAALTEGHGSRRRIRRAGRPGGCANGAGILIEAVGLECATFFHGREQ